MKDEDRKEDDDLSIRGFFSHIFYGLSWGCLFGFGFTGLSTIMRGGKDDNGERIYRGVHASQQIDGVQLSTSIISCHVMVYTRNQK